MLTVLLIILILVALFGGGWGYRRGGWDGPVPGGLLGLIILIILLYLLFGGRLPD